MELFRESRGCVFTEEPAVLICCKHVGNDIKMIKLTTVVSRVIYHKLFLKNLVPAQFLALEYGEKWNRFSLTKQIVAQLRKESLVSYETTRLIGPQHWSISFTRIYFTHALNTNFNTNLSYIDTNFSPLSAHF
jgi:hypothetical protein